MKTRKETVETLKKCIQCQKDLKFYRKLAMIFIILNLISSIAAIISTLNK